MRSEASPGPGAPPPVPSFFKVEATSARLAWRAGASPNSRPATTVRVMLNARTVMFRLRSSVIGKGSGRSAATRPFNIPDARSTPAAPPAVASRTLSVSNCRISVPRRAPMASRIATSFFRSAAWASRKLARFAQAISKISPTTVIIRVAAGTRMRSIMGFMMTSSVATSVKTLSACQESGYCCLREIANRSVTALAWTRETPGSSRALTKVLWLSRAWSSSVLEGLRCPTIIVDAYSCGASPGRLPVYSSGPMPTMEYARPLSLIS